MKLRRETARTKRGAHTSQVGDASVSPEHLGSLLGKRAAAHAGRRRVKNRAHEFRRRRGEILNFVCHAEKTPFTEEWNDRIVPSVVIDDSVSEATTRRGP